MQTNTGGLLAGLLGIVFITLKLCGVITWPWVWVLAPFWVGIAIALLFLAALLIIALFLWAMSRLAGW
jgi:hypothetical protein